MGFGPNKVIHSESIFVDSGAHTLYNLYVLKHGPRIGKHGRPLAKPLVRWSQGDFSYYDLKKGSEFRTFCDSYAGFMKKMQGNGVLLANIDAISNPDLTWEIQRFFEEEHGVRPIPIVHYGTPMKYVDRYIGYPLLGVGGLGQGVSRHEYFSWADEFFIHICPKENDYLPLIRTHGFAMTSWELICRYPWWSVDSATWVKLSAYGWLYIPRWRQGCFRFDEPPMMINFSHRSPQKKIAHKHYDNLREEHKIDVTRWLEHNGMTLGSVIGKGKKAEVDSIGISSHHRARSIANLTYLKDLEESRPKWPYPLDIGLVADLTVKFQRPGILGSRS